jgi:peptidoglycan-associated lipoprotein
MRICESFLVGSLVLAGCAHAPPPEQTVTETHASAAPPRVAEAPKPAPAPAPAPTADADLEALLRGDVVHFGFDEAQLTGESQQRLQKLSQVMQAHPEVQLTVAGNCDELGTEEYNLALGQKRAAVAKAYLQKLGVDPARVNTVSYGKERPLESGHDEQARAANRRDDLTLRKL